MVWKAAAETQAARLEAIEIQMGMSVAPARPQERQLAFILGAICQRAEVVAALGCVDYVILFNEPDPQSLIAALQPDVLVKGGDWAVERIVGN